MTLLNDHQIASYCRDRLPSLNDDRMISPFIVKQTREVEGRGVISFGLSSFGYDMRMDKLLKIGKETEDELRDFKNIDDFLAANSIDPKAPNEKQWEVYHDSWDPVVIPPFSHILGVSLEKWNMPLDVMGLVIGKSTYARCGIIINVTPMEPGWKGNLTLEIENVSGLPVKMYPGEGVAQVLFLRGDKPDINYALRSGKYQDAEGIGLPKV